ncbi:MAG: adenylosuccinate lyase, partial [Clostridia bacterium]|nr:adenylosuccinate lyase [Clostridia bacterium]
LVVNEKVIGRRLMEKLPFMATENILMDAVKRGGNRQELHEKLRVHSQAAAKAVKEGKPNDLISRIANDAAFGMNEAEIVKLLDPEKFTGRSVSQVEEFVSGVIDPVILRYPDEVKSELKV